jgi:uncharacterized protein (TIGR03067 family)
MKTIAAFALGLGLLGWVGLAAQAQDKKDAPKLEGKYTLVGGKTKGKDLDDEAKKGTYTFAADKVTIEGMGLKFVMSYKIDPKTTPMNVDMEILEGPEGTKGSKAQGIIEVKGDTVKLAYMVEKDKRPKDFEGKEGNMYELKKAK